MGEKKSNTVFDRCSINGSYHCNDHSSLFGGTSDNGNCIDLPLVMVKQSMVLIASFQKQRNMTIDVHS